jgi:GT2 family glycosyltransferase
MLPGFPVLLPRHYTDRHLNTLSRPTARWRSIQLMWQSEKMRAPYAMHDIEVIEPLAPIVLAPLEGGAHVLVRHRGRPVGRVWLSRAEHGANISAETLAPLVAGAALGPVGTLVVRDALLGEAGPAPTPLLTIAVCSRNRATLLRRCLAALVAMRDARLKRGPAVDILVVDNAPSNDHSRQAAADFPGVRYAMEPIPGLDFGRNHALANTDRPWLAYVDDDAVVDRLWLERLAEAIAASPATGCFCGPVLPLMLETEAQLRFERAGGFGKGFDWERYGPERWDDRVYPANAGRFGTGACMVFRTEALRNLGGFDEALDTGPPLPGGGDLDIFYRIVRAGYRLIYVPGLLVHHEHRRDMASLFRQYYSWGQSVMALLRKNEDADPGMRGRQRALLLYWTSAKLRALLRSLAGRGPHPPPLVLAEIGGGIAGYFGEYRRSQARIAARKREYGT